MFLHEASNAHKDGSLAFALNIAKVRPDMPAWVCSLAFFHACLLSSVETWEAQGGIEGRAGDLCLH